MPLINGSLSNFSIVDLFEVAKIFVRYILSLWPLKSACIRNNLGEMECQRVVGYQHFWAVITGFCREGLS
jgi:hypothetical protein